MEKKSEFMSKGEKMTRKEDFEALDRILAFAKEDYILEKDKQFWKTLSEILRKNDFESLMPWWDYDP